MLPEFLLGCKGCHGFYVSHLHVGIQFHQLFLHFVRSRILLLGGYPLMPVRAHAWRNRSGHQPLQLRMPIYGEEVFVQPLVGGYHIELLEITAALHAGSPAYHEIVGKFLAFLFRELAVELPVLAIELGHLVGDGKFFHYQARL